MVTAKPLVRHTYPVSVFPAAKEQLKAVVEAVGFANPEKSGVAEALLDDPDSILEPPYIDNVYLLTGLYKQVFVGVHIIWEEGKQPIVKRVEPPS